jgi:hypothetical protein
MAEAPKPNFIAEAAREYRAESASRRRSNAPNSAIHEGTGIDPIEEDTRRECAINDLHRIASLCKSEALALERGDDALASCHWEVIRLLARDKAAATRSIYERANRHLDSEQREQASDREKTDAVS